MDATKLSAAALKTPAANHCVIRLLQPTASPFTATQGGKLFARNNLHVRAHGVMARAAKLPASRLVLAGLRKLQLRLCNHARNRFDRIWSAPNGKCVHIIGARNPQMNRNSGRDNHAVWYEQILLRNHAHRDRAIGILLGAKVVFYKLSRKV